MESNPSLRRYLFAPRPSVDVHRAGIELSHSRSDDALERPQPYTTDAITIDENARVASPGLSVTPSYSSVTLRDDALLLPTAHDDSVPRQHQKRRFLSGWRIGALLSIIGAITVVITNVAVIIWVRNHSAYKAGDSFATLQEGSCARTRRLSTWVHLLINVLSTLLLCASNYCMQVLIAPNRKELDRAHARRRWLHIGVPSLHNLTRIAWDRALLWILLMLSSLPLHFLYNSVIFTNLQANTYMVVPGEEAWLRGGIYNFDCFENFSANQVSGFESTIHEYQPDLNATVVLNGGTVVPKYKNVSTAECFNEYDNQYTSEAGNVYLVQDNCTVWRNQDTWRLGFHNTTRELRWFKRPVPLGDTYIWQDDTDSTFPFISKPGSYPSNRWRCASHRKLDCDVDDEREVPRDRLSWAPYESSVRYCMMEQVPEKCQLRFSFLIAGLVITANIVKVLCMAIMLFWHREHDAIVTLGDALASFLERPDPHTRLRCLQTLSDIKKHWSGYRPNQSKLSKRREYVEVDASPILYTMDRRRWLEAPSDSRWFATYIFYFGALIFGIVCSVRSLKGMTRSPAKLWSIGFGTVNGQNLIPIKTSLIGGILLTNSPQVVLSYLYVTFNGLYTTMFIDQEWAMYKAQRKTLRVTAPLGQQRSTYWLSVPFRYAIPMTCMSGLLHWISSQAFFLVQIMVTDLKTRRTDPAEQISTCGYSPLGIILGTVTMTVIALGGIIIGFFQYPAGMPLAASCSAAISAACHPPPEDVDASVKPVQWGAVSTHMSQAYQSTLDPFLSSVDTAQASEADYLEAVGHCTFTSFPVEPPLVGRLYA